MLLREGEPAERFYLIRHGMVALEVDAPGRGPLVIETLDEGEVVGWSWLFAPYRWAMDGRAVGDVQPGRRSTAPACAASARPTTSSATS